MNSSNKTDSNFVRNGAMLGIVSPIVWIMLIILMGLLNPDYSHLTNFISDLGAIEAPNPYVQRINFFQFGFSISLLAIAIFKGMERSSVAMLILQLIIGLGIFFSGVFPGHSLDPESHKSFLHNIVGLPAFICIILLPLIAGFKFRRMDNWKDLANYSMLMTPVLALMLFLMIREDIVEDNGYPGLYQRFFIGIWILWIIMVSIRLKKLKDFKTNRQQRV